MTTEYLDSRNFPSRTPADDARLAEELGSILADDLQGDAFSMLGRYQRILADNGRRHEWDGVFHKLEVLFECGKAAPLDGPMIGVTLAVRDSDYFREPARLFGKDRSLVAQLEWMAALWNTTFAATGLWMGKTFEPVSRHTLAAKCGGDPRTMERYDPGITRIGRNFFRKPADRRLLQSLGLPVLTRLWHLRDRPRDAAATGFDGELTEANLEKEKVIPYVKTGGLFLSHTGNSVVAEMNGKSVYQLNYRWPALQPAYPMTRLIDELVQIAEGVYLGQLVMATHHFSLGTLRISLFGDAQREWDLGEPFSPEADRGSYGYQNNGFFLMIDPAFAARTYADGAFAYLRPREGESGHRELGYDRIPAAAEAGSGAGGSAQAAGPYAGVTDWVNGWRDHPELKEKFTTFCLEPSPRPGDGDVRELIRDGESVLQMLQRIQSEIQAQARYDDHLRHFERLNRLFRCGVAPRVVDGLFQGQGRGYNVRFDAPEKVRWYGQEEPCRGFDFYHGATLNLHFGFADTFSEKMEDVSGRLAFPSALAALLQSDLRGPNVLDAVWASIGRFIFPWAGKSFQRISGRKLSMLLDESDDLAERYPERVEELRSHLASRPHYDLVRRNREHAFGKDGPYAPYLKSGSWDERMSEADKEVWRKLAREKWVFGMNLQDSRILRADAAMRMLDMNYGPPLPSLQDLALAGPSPFVRQGYMFLGVADERSIRPMNNGEGKAKRVFQFHYRYPMIGGPVPIGTCLDELVEIAQGLFLGQLIYSTLPLRPFHSSVDPAEYQYQLFGYFLLLDHAWERHRQAIGFDIDT